jgi:hypothetical protein
LRQALEIGVLDRARRDAFRGRIVFPNRLGGHIVDLQGRLLPSRGTLVTEKKPMGPLYLNLPRPHVHLFNEPATLHKMVVVCEGIPDTLSVLRAGIPAFGLYGAQGWHEVYRATFRRCERVYVALDRDAIDKSTALNDVVMKDVKVLAIDQLADERAEKPSVVKAVTLEVDISGAQKLALAGQIGTLALALRKAGDAAATASRPITLADLMGTRSSEDRDAKYATISITRAMNKTLYSVPRVGGEDHPDALTGQGSMR